MARILLILHILNRPCRANILGSCNGLLLIKVKDRKHYYNNEDYFLWNPSINKCMKICGLESNQHSGEEYVLSGLGYRSTTDNYKAVVISKYVSPPGSPISGFNFESTNFSVYNFNRNSWRHMRREFPYTFLYSRIGVTVKGAPHWVVWSVLHNSVVYVIVYFDLGKEEFREVPLPDWLPEAEYAKIELGSGILDGCLCITR